MLKHVDLQASLEHIYRQPRFWGSGFLNCASVLLGRTLGRGGASIDTNDRLTPFAWVHRLN